MTKKKNNRFFLIVLLFILFIVILGSSLYYLNHSKSNNAQNTKAYSEKKISEKTTQRSSTESSSSIESNTSSSMMESTSVSEVNQSIDMNAMLGGDFSSVAGNWKNGEEQFLTINNDGTTTDGQTITIRTQQNTAGIVTGDIRNVTGAVISFLSPNSSLPNIVDHSDVTKVRIIIYQDIWDFSDEAYYYKM